MLRISSVWRIRQIKFQKQSLKCRHLCLFYEILLGSEQLQNIIKEGDFVVELDQFKYILSGYEGPLVEVRDSL